MSCFSGRFFSLPGLRCDRFDCLDGEGSTVPAHQLFLSHCHTDHMVGLEDVGSFLKKRRRGTGPRKLYCSMISSVFVQKKYPDIPREAIVEMLPNHPLTISVSACKSVYNLRVTGINANHCPGSLMFLMEKLDSTGTVCSRILYTGDFRFDNLGGKYLARLHALHSGTIPLHIDEMYLDTTFCSPMYPSFPPRQVAEENIWKICDEWVKKNRSKKTRQKHAVLLDLPARYGYENIFHHIYQRSGYEWRVHVPSTKFSEYLCHSSLEDCTDPDPSNAPHIHACSTSTSQQLSCQPSGGVALCRIRPSAMFFTQDRMGDLKEASGLENLVGVSKGTSSYRVCYSTHSSLEELEIFVKYFSPSQMTPCAIPRGSTKEEVGDILESFLQDRDHHSQESLGKICYNDTLDINADDLVYEEEIGDPVSAAHKVSYGCNNLVLELSEEEDHIEFVASRDNSIEVVEVEEENPDCLDDTPEIEDIIADAEANKLPEYVVKTMKEYKRTKDIVFVID